MNNERGSVLFLVVIFVVIMGALGMANIYMNNTEELMARQELSRARALYAAEAGLERAYAVLKTTTCPPAGTQAFPLFGGPVTHDASTLPHSTYEVSIDPDDANPGKKTKYYTITSTGTAGNCEKVIRQGVAMTNTFKYVYFSEHEYPYGEDAPDYSAAALAANGAKEHLVYFTTEDSITRLPTPAVTDPDVGWIHSNDIINVTGTPTLPYNGTSCLIETANNFFYYTPPSQCGLRGSANGIPGSNSSTPWVTGSFPVGSYPLVPSVNLFARRDFDKLLQIATGQQTRTAVTHVFTGDFDIGVFTNRFVIYQSGDFAPPSPAKSGGVQVSTSDNDTVVYINGNVTALCNDWAGTPNKQPVTMGNRGTLVVTGNVKITNVLGNYFKAGAITGDGMLGLVVGGDVIIPATYPDPHIDAIIMCRDLSAEGEQTLSPPNTVHLFGSLMQQYRGVAGRLYVSGSQATGYRKDYTFDHRLIDAPPPYFPVILETGRRVRSEGPLTRTGS